MWTYVYLYRYHHHFLSPQRHLSPPAACAACAMAETDEGLLCSKMYRVPSTHMKCCLDCGVCQGNLGKFGELAK